MENVIKNIIQQEEQRQSNQISLIASENYTSSHVRYAQGSCLTNKYAEGYPGKRYYGGCIYVDKAEELAIEYAKKIFNVNYVNVQPLSGSQANQAVYFALLEHGDTILSMCLSQGGHLSHGSKVNWTSKFYNIIQYGLDQNFDIDYNQIQNLANIHKPKLIIAGFSCFSMHIDFEKFKNIADSIGAILLADIAHVAGLIASNVYPSPVKYAHVITCTTHKTLRGPRGGMIMTNDHAIFKKIQKSVFPGLQGGPLMHVIAGKAQAFYECSLPSFKEYALQIIKNAQCICKCFIENGINVIQKNIQNHIILVDLRNINITGKDAQILLEQQGIVCNMNVIPNDPQPATITSGIRIGTAAITTRGMKEKQAYDIAEIIIDIIKNKALRHKDIKQLCELFPIP